MAEESLMKTSILIAAILAIAGCATPYRDREALRAERLAKEARERQAAEEARLRASENTKTEVAGSDEKAFLNSHGQPDTEELIEGATVYHYNYDNKPMIFVFRQGKLTSKMIDRDRVREISDKENQRVQAAEQERTQRLMLWQSMQNSQPVAPANTYNYQLPVNRPSSTNCTTYKVGNQLQTNCTGN